MTNLTPDSAIAAIERALAEGPTDSPRTVEALSLTDGHHNVGIRVRGKHVSGYMAVMNTRWPHAEQQREQTANAALIAACDPAALRLLLAALREAQEDAARYRWLRSSGLSDVYVMTGCDFKGYCMEGLDAAIDAARTQEKSHG